MELEMDALATKRGGHKYEVFVTDDVEGVTLSLDQYKEMADAPNYQRVGDASLQRCATCHHFTDSGRCHLYSFKADAMYTCDSWRPDIEELKKARTERKEVSATPTAVYAHGPGGLFSPAGLGDTVATGRKRKKRKPARDGALVNAMITTKPGDKYRSIKNPAAYEALIRKGMSKSQAAAISNAMVKRGKKKSKETAVTPLEYAKTLKHLGGQHNQASHGFRFGATPSLERARRYRKAGVLSEYTKRARTPERAGQRERGRLNREAADDLIRQGVGVPRARDFRDYLKRQGATVDGNKLKYQGRTIQYGAGKQKLDLADSETQRAIANDIKRIDLEGKQQTYGPYHKDRAAGKQLFKKGRYGKELNLVSWDGKLRVNAKIKDQMGVLALGVKRPGEKRYSGYRIMSSWDITEYLSQFREEANKEYTPLEYAKTLKHLSGQHAQASHGFRFGRTPSLEQARRYRKAGVLGEYMKRASGDKPTSRQDAYSRLNAISKRHDEISGRQHQIASALKRATGDKKAKLERERDRLSKEVERGAVESRRLQKFVERDKKGLSSKPKQTAANKKRITEAEQEYLRLNKRYSHARAVGADTTSIDKQRNAALERLAGLLGVTPYQIVPTASGVFVSKEKREPSTFTVFKDKTGRYRWVAISSTAYRDRDGEIVSTKALTDDVQRADASGDYGPLRWWHVPGLDLGDCDFNMVYGRSLIESGTFISDRIAERVKENAHSLKLSLGFRHPADEPDKSGVFHTIRRFERSLIPPEGNASNLFTKLAVI